MINRIAQGQPVGEKSAARAPQKGKDGGFEALLQQRLAQAQQPAIQFSKHAISRAEERGIELTPTLMGKLANSVEKAQEKGATNILALDTTQAFIINVPYGRVITTMTQEEMKENFFTNIDGAVLL